MKASDFHFELPEQLIAQRPLATRSASRLLLADARNARIGDRQFVDLPDLLSPGDLLVSNDTRVLPARIHAHRASGGKVEIMLERLRPGREVVAQLRMSKQPQPGEMLALDAGGEVEWLGREGEFHRLRFAGTEPVADLLARVGHMPLPLYVRRADDSQDAERYQTLFATTPGAVAAPTAGLHFDEPLLARIAERGIARVNVTLHVGAGTFQPVRVENLAEHRMHAEWVEVSEATCQAIRETRARGGRVIAVGTTVVRALESAWSDGEVRPFSGETRIFIHPGVPIRSVQGLVTNFHLPGSTLLMLVSAFAGREFILAAYRHAVDASYRFFSYGVAMLIWPAEGAP